MASFFARYKSGETSEVWADLRALGPEVRDSRHIEDTRAVCDEMARRALRNIETLIEKLSADGYVFRDATDWTEQAPLLRPSADVDSLITWINESIGTLPLAVESWMRIVGDVNLVGVHPQWEAAEEADPLVLEFAGLRYPDSDVRDYYACEWEWWSEDIGEIDDPADVEPFLLPVAPDSLHKANISGSTPYGFPLPDLSAEGVFANEDADIQLVHEPFVDYLNRAFRAGGFPGQRVGAPAGWREKYATGLHVL